MSKTLVDRTLLLADAHKAAAIRLVANKPPRDAASGEEFIIHLAHLYTLVETDRDIEVIAHTAALLQARVGQRRREAELLARLKP